MVGLRLVVDHDSALVRPAVPLRKTRALWLPVECRAVVGNLQLAPIVREVGGVGHGERVGRKELRRGDRARARHVATDHAASAARGRKGAVQALAVQGPQSRPGNRQRGAPRPSGCPWTRRRPW